MPVGTVSTAMHITSGTMTSVLDTLERGGFVERVTDPDDRRRVLVDVTPAAQDVLDQLLPAVVQTATAALAGIPADELHRFLGTLATMCSAISAVPDDLGPSAGRRPPPELRRK